MSSRMPSMATWPTSSPSTAPGRTTISMYPGRRRWSPRPCERYRNCRSRALASSSTRSRTPSSHRPSRLAGIALRQCRKYSPNNRGRKKKTATMSPRRGVMAFQQHEVDRRTLFKAGLGATVAAVVGTQLAFEGAADAVPSAEFPWIIDCDSWGARPPSSKIQITGNTTNKIILHHMAFPNVTDYSREHAIQLAKDCQNLHMDINGWADTGQHFTVSRGGYVLEGRHRSLETLDAGQHQVISAHCPGENGNAIGIETEGTYITETPPAGQLDSVVKLCAAVATQFRLHAWDIFGHWDFR